MESGRRVRVLALSGIGGVALLVLSACGSGADSSGSATSTSAAQKAPAVGAVAVQTTSAGQALVDARKMTLYAFAKDSRGHSACTGSCLAYWPPAPGGDAAAGASAGVSAKLGSITRDDGTKQLTVNGYPVYTYAGDTQAGDAGGQGMNLSGGLWWVVSPTGSWIKGSAPQSSGARGGY